MKIKLTFLATFYFIISLGLFAQSDAIPVISTDHESNSSSPYIIPKGFFQIETGFKFTNEVSDNFTREEIDIFGTLLRYGVFDNFEVRLWGSLSSIDYNYPEPGIDSTNSGFGRFSVGFKIHLVEEKGIRPQMAIIAEMVLRHIGADGIHPTYSYPVSKIAASHTLSKKFTLGYNLGFAFNGEDPDGFFIYSGILNYSVLPKLSIFVEPYGNFDANDFPNHYADGGLTYLIRHNMQLDLTAGVSIGNNINRNAESINKKFIQLGYAWRIPK